MKEEKAEETANLLYVAATRAVKSLTILLRADKEGALKGFSELMARTAKAAIPDAERTEFGWRHDYGPEKPRPSDHEELTAPDLAEGPAAPAEGEEMDPTLRSADIEAGIERGLRIHEALARLAGDLRTPAPASLAPNNLNKDEQAAVERFLSDPKVREILFRPGKVLTEQHLSDTRSFGIVDRLIIAPDRITLIDFKTGRVGHLADKYRLQMIRYRTILQGLFPGRPIEGYLLFVDEPHRIVTQLCALAPLHPLRACAPACARRSAAAKGWRLCGGTSSPSSPAGGTNSTRPTVPPSRGRSRSATNWSGSVRSWGMSGRRSPSTSSPQRNCGCTAGAALRSRWWGWATRPASPMGAPSSCR